MQSSDAADLEIVQLRIVSSLAPSDCLDSLYPIFLSGKLTPIIHNNFQHACIISGTAYALVEESAAFMGCCSRISMEIDVGLFADFEA